MPSYAVTSKFVLETVPSMSQMCYYKQGVYLCIAVHYLARSCFSLYYLRSDMDKKRFVCRLTLARTSQHNCASRYASIQSAMPVVWSTSEYGERLLERIDLCLHG